MTLKLTRWIVDSRYLSLAMLLTLHLALWAGVDSIWSRPLLFAHVGFFLLWQPLWRGEEHLSTRRSITIITISALAMWWLNWWVLAFWVSGLFALVGGRVFTFQRLRQRLRYLLAMAYLLGVLLLWLTPQLFMLQSIGEVSKNFMQYVLPLLLLSMALVPHERERLKKIVAIDFIYSILLFMLLTLLVLGSLAFMSLGHVDYFQALLRTLFFMGLLLFVLGWLWGPRLGFSGLQFIFSRSFLNMGTPFELWLNQLAKIAQQEPSPAIFLNIATGHLAELTWLSGLNWECDESKGQQGVSSPYPVNISEHDLHLTLFTRQRASPSVLMHIHLLCQMLAYFYQAKRREQRLREMARLQAVHETGARLTHDLKNMLQSLYVLISIADKQAAQAQPILQQQLPVLVQRIELTLAKLKIPEHEADATMIPLSMWWSALNQRQQYRNIDWSCEDKLAEQLIPFTLFDSVVDNLIENARNKRLREPDMTISVSLQAHPLCLSVRDSGSKIPEALASQLLQTVVESEHGFGVGLFQAARWAEQSGYRLALKENREGSVCFTLIENK